jgi:formate hydrogenlyase subunit 6/NADH:ubiquinone oxidoreductase subunit I
MTTKIFYFTGTGNTLYIAKELAKKLGNTELVAITYDMNFDQLECTTVGIAYPVYCFGLPNIVSNFLKKVKLNKNTYIFGLSTYGGLLANSGNVLKKKLKQQEYNLMASFAIHMPGNATMIYNVAGTEKQQNMFSKGNEYISKIAFYVTNQTPHKTDTNLGLLGKMMSSLCDKMLSKMNESDKSFFVDDNCDGCSICAKVCPVNNIQIKNKKPEWLHKCECCLACFHWCPKASIQANKKTSQRGRYHQPDIKLKELIK